MRHDAHIPTSARPAILAAARHLFAARGFAGTSMREIAEAAGVSKAAIYHHFRDKRRLYRELLDEGINTLTAAMRRLPDKGPARAQLARILLLHLEFARAHADLLRMMVHEQWQAGERGVAGGESKPVAPALSAQALCVVIDIISAGFVMAAPPVSAAEVAQNVMDVLLNGLAATPVAPAEVAELFTAKEKTA